MSKIGLESNHLNETINRLRPDNFPEEYGHFEKIDDYLKNLSELDELRDNESYNTVYGKMWLGLCMVVDKKNQSLLEDNLKKKVEGLKVDSEEYKNEVNEYWKKMEEKSVYPIYKKVRNKLDFNGYGESALDNWNKPFSKNYVLAGTDKDKIYVAVTENVYSNIWDNRLVSETFGSADNQGKNASTMAFHKRFDEIIADEGMGNNSELKGYIASLHLMTSSRNIVLGYLKSQINQFDQVNSGKMEITVPDWSEHIDKMMCKIEPYHCFSKKIGERIIEREEEMFGDNAEIASVLWRSVAFLRTNKIEGRSRGLNIIKEPAIRRLINNDYKGASSEIYTILEKSPEALPDFIKNKLKENPDYLKAMMISAEEKRQKSKDGGIIRIRLGTEASEESEKKRLYSKEKHREYVSEIKDAQRQLFERFSKETGYVYVSDDGRAKLEIGPTQEGKIVYKLANQIDGRYGGNKENYELGTGNDLYLVIKGLGLKHTPGFISREMSQYGKEMETYYEMLVDKNIGKVLADESEGVIVELDKTEDENMFLCRGIGSGSVSEILKSKLAVGKLIFNHRLKEHEELTNIKAERDKKILLDNEKRKEDPLKYFQENRDAVFNDWLHPFRKITINDVNAYFEQVLCSFNSFEGYPDKKLITISELDHLIDSNRFDRFGGGEEILKEWRQKRYNRWRR